MSKTEKLAAQAFPVPFEAAALGMTLRDWFAGQALVGLVSATDSAGLWTAPLSDQAGVTAERAYELADALLAQREEKL